MKYQLILQFQAASTSNFEEFVALEEALIDSLGPSSEVDGHDFGSGEFNIFILTQDPESAFSAAQNLIHARNPGQQLKAAYRKIGGEGFLILWPPMLKTFRIT